MMTLLFHRRPLALIGCLATVILAGCAGSGSKTPTGGSGAVGRSITVGVQEPYSLLATYVARDQGFLKQHGISSVKFVPFTSLPAMVTAIAHGEITSGLQTPALVATYNSKTAGSKLLLFAPGQIFNFVWTARKGTGVPVATSTTDWQKTVLAWRGKRIGVPAIGGLGDLVTRYLARQVGLVPDKDFQIVISGTGPTEVAALRSGAADVVSGDAYGASALTVTGVGYNVLNMARGQGPAVFSKTFESGYLGSASAMQSNKALFTGYAAAIAQAQAYMRDPSNKGSMIQILMKDIGVTPSVASVLYSGVSSFQAQLTPTTWDSTSKAFVKSGLIAPPAPGYSAIIANLG